MSANSKVKGRWLPKSLWNWNEFEPWTQSVTSSRLLVTPFSTKGLMQIDADGFILRRVCLPSYMEPIHAVESPNRTFIVSESHRVSEVDTGGQVLRKFTGLGLIRLGKIPHIAVDSQGNIFVADGDNCRILLLDAQLVLLGVIIDEHQLNYQSPWRLYYRERSRQLLVGFAGVGHSAAVFKLFCKSQSAAKPMGVPNFRTHVARKPLDRF